MLYLGLKQRTNFDDVNQSVWPKVKWWIINYHISSVPTKEYVNSFADDFKNSFEGPHAKQYG